MTNFPQSDAAREIDRLAKAEIGSNASAAALDTARARLWMERGDLYHKHQREVAMPDFQAAIQKAQRETSGGGALAKTNPEATLEVRAQEVAQRDGISFAKAYDSVLLTPEGAELYAKHRATRMVAKTDDTPAGASYGSTVVSSPSTSTEREGPMTFYEAFAKRHLRELAKKGRN